MWITKGKYITYKERQTAWVIFTVPDRFGLYYLYKITNNKTVDLMGKVFNLSDGIHLILSDK